MTFFLSVLFYLGAHFSVYFLALRHLRLFQREKPILLYHVVSFLAWGVWFFAAQPVGITSAIGLLSLHGIYSLSFLELWALSDGGFSLRILENAGDTQGCTAAQLESMRVLGGAKIRGRIQTLERWRLVTEHENKYRLTGFGRVFAAALKVIAWPSLPDRQAGSGGN